MVLLKVRNKGFRVQTKGFLTFKFAIGLKVLARPRQCQQLSQSDIDKKSLILACLLSPISFDGLPSYVGELDAPGSPQCSSF